MGDYNVREVQVDFDGLPVSVGSVISDVLKLTLDGRHSRLTTLGSCILFMQDHILKFGFAIMRRLAGK